MLKFNKESPPSMSIQHVDPQKEHEIQSLKIQLKSLQVELVKSKSKPLPFPKPPQTRMTSYYPDPY